MFELFLLGGLVAALFQFMGTPNGKQVSKHTPGWVKIVIVAVLFAVVMGL